MRAPLRITSVLLATALASPGCGGGDYVEAAEPGPGALRRARVERMATTLRANVARMDAQGLENPVLQALTGLHDRYAEEDWIPFDDWGLGLGEVRNYLRLSAPDAQGRVFALHAAAPEHPLHALARATGELDARRIRLIVVPIPKRLQVYPDRLPEIEPRDDFVGADVAYERLMLRLTEAGIEVIDLLPAFVAERYDRSGTDDELLYLDYDAHWTPRGTALAADLIAERIRELEWFVPGPLIEGVHYRETVEQGTRAVSCPLPEGNGEVPLWYRRVQTPRGRALTPHDPESPILLLGDSFATWYREESSDLIRLLHARLGWRIDAITHEGAAGTIWNEVDERGGLEGKRVLVWTFAAGALSGGRMQEIDPDRR